MSANSFFFKVSTLWPTEKNGGRLKRKESYYLTMDVQNHVTKNTHGSISESQGGKKVNETPKKRHEQ